jgi:hypothetical protein
MGALEKMALVCAADDPLDNRRTRFPHCWLRILVEGDPSIYAAAKFKFDPDHWPVRGMELPIVIDPDSPQDFKVVWDEVPPIEKRAAANDPSLADPIGAHRRVIEALISAGVAGKGAPAPERKSVGDLAGQALKHAFRRAPSLTETDQDEFQFSLHEEAVLVDGGDLGSVVGHFDESMEKIAAEPAPPGTVRAGVLFSAHAATLESQGSGDLQTSYFERHGKHAVVLSVNVPGKDPYAAYVEKFDHKKGKAGIHESAALPALVSATDPNEVDVQWDEMISAKEAKKQGKQAAAERVNALMERRQAGAQPGAAGADPMDTYKQNARAALDATANNPVSRQMVIDQYRRLGVKISETGEVED